MPRRPKDEPDEEVDPASDEGGIDYDYSDIDGGGLDEEADDYVEVPEIDVEATVPTNREVESNRAAITRTPADIYAEFRARSERNIAELDRIHSLAVQTFPRSTPSVRVQALRAATAAVWTKQKVADQTILRGQELGLLPTAVKQQRTSMNISGGVLVGAMSDADLTTRMRDLAQEGKRLRDEYDGASFAKIADPVDIYEGIIPDEEEKVKDPVRVHRVKA